MVSLLSPLWLLGLTALTVPIALHLWSRRGGRPVRVGSIRLMLGAPPATRRSWRVQDPWLLLLRCAVLAALSITLTRPVWMPHVPAGGGAARVALVSPDVAGADLLRDSLTRAGVPVRSLIDENYWAALRDAAALPAAPTSRVLVFAPAPLLRRFAGERPALHAIVEWHERPVGAPPSHAPARSSPARIVAIYADPDRRDDARYVAAAFRAAALGTGIPAVIAQRSTAAPDVVGGAEWLVWLSARPLPEPVRDAARAGATVLQDATGRDAELDSATITLASGAADARVYRRGEASGAETAGAAPVWREGTGAPLLTAAREGRGLLLTFRSRFHPSWSDLVLRPSFPEALAGLWSGPLAAPVVLDDRRIALSQLLPAHDATLSRARRESARSLFLPLWLLTVLLFAVERWWSSR